MKNSFPGFALTFSVCPMASDLTNGIEAVGREQKHTSGETAAFVQAFSILLWASAAGTVVGPLFTGFAGDLLGWGNMNICLGAFALTGVVAVVSHSRQTLPSTLRLTLCRCSSRKIMKITAGE